MHKSMDLISGTKLGMVAHAHWTSTWEAEAKEPEVQVKQQVRGAACGTIFKEKTSNRNHTKIRSKVKSVMKSKGLYFYVCTDV